MIQSWLKEIVSNLLKNLPNYLHVESKIAMISHRFLAARLPKFSVVLLSEWIKINGARVRKVI